MKRILVLFVTLFFIFNISDSVLAAPKVMLNGQQLSSDVAPIMNEGHILVPLRAVFEALGVDVGWNENTQSITATKNEMIVNLQINSKVAYKNKQAFSIEVAPTIVENRTLVPLSFVSQALGANVDWNDENQTITISNNLMGSLKNDGDLLTVVDTGESFTLEEQLGYGAYYLSATTLVSNSGTDYNLVEITFTNGESNFVSTKPIT